MNQEQEQCKVCGRAKLYVQFRPNPIMVCKLGHHDDEPVKVEQPKQKPIRTTRMKLEITDKLLHDMKDSALKCQVLKRINDCEYDMDLMRTLADVVIEMAEQMEDTYIKKHVYDSGKTYQSFEPNVVTLQYRTTGIK